MEQSLNFVFDRINFCEKLCFYFSPSSWGATLPILVVIYNQVTLDIASSNEVIRAVLNPLFFFYKKILHAPKATKSTKTQPSKNTKRYTRTKIKNALKKHRRGKKSLIRLFAFLCLRKKENRKTRKVATM